MALSHAIMTALLDQKLTGYELAKQFDVSLGFFWQASHQQIYQQLKVLAVEGLVASAEVPQSGKPDKKIYRLTGAGRLALTEWVRGETKRKPAKDDLFVKLYNLGAVAPELLISEIEVRLGQHRERLALYERIRERGYQNPTALSKSRRGMYLALLAGIYQERSAIDWCAEALQLLQSA